MLGTEKRKGTGNSETTYLEKNLNSTFAFHHIKPIYALNI
jgi:hypothetical protein